MIEVVIYRRVSSDRQSDEGRSLEDQDAGLIDYCKAMNWKIIGNFQDAISGRREKTEKRVGLGKATALAIERKAVFLIHDLDRLSRSQSAGMRIVEQLRDSGAKLVVKSLGIDTNTPVGEMILGIMFSVAQWGSKNIGAMVKRANANTIRRLGHRTQGRPPYGWDFSPEEECLVHVEVERAIIRFACRLQRNGSSLRKIAAQLNAEGYRTRCGKEWSAEAVRRAIGKAKQEKRLCSEP